jgi:ParB-like nuclease domain
MAKQAATAGKVKLGHVPISTVLLSSIRPSAKNKLLYRPVNSDDPEIVALAASIREHGLREPLVITADHIIISGHRRFAACRLAGLKEVACRIERIRSTDPEFLTLLREYNRQRVKTLAEMAREEILSADPEESYRVLLKHRRQKAHINFDPLDLRGATRRPMISLAKKPFIDAVRNVLETYREFLPLTDRQIHYALLNSPPLIHANKPGSIYRNDRNSYKALCDLVTRARLEGHISFEAIHDPTRPVTQWLCHANVAGFIRAETDDFLKGYYRNLLQSQPNHIEIVGEKNTLKSILEPVAANYRIPLTIGRGYCSLPPRNAMAQRFEASGKEKLILLILCDFDPEGEDICNSFARSMRDDFGIEDIFPVKVALTSNQVEELRLPPVMQAKKTSSRYRGFFDRHGDNVFELEAVPPDRLQAILREAIDSVLDIEAFNAEIDGEKNDARYLHGLRQALKERIQDVDLKDE